MSVESMTPWPQTSVANAIEAKRGRNTRRLQTNAYQAAGAIPIVDQGADLICGYTDDLSASYPYDLPVVVFGDHTRTLKFVDFPFAIGADGTQCLHPTGDFEPLFFYYALRNIDLRGEGYARHFKLLKEKHLPVPSRDEQRRIAEVLQSVDEASSAAQVAASHAERCLDVHCSFLMQEGIRAASGLWSEGRCDEFLVLQRGFDITERQVSPGPYAVISSSGPSYSHSEFAVEGPAVITGRKGKLGAVFFSEGRCWPHDTTLWVKDFKGNDPRFIFWKLRSMKLGAYDAATSVPTLNRNNVHALTVRFPPVDEQREIAAVLDSELLAIQRQTSHRSANQNIAHRLADDLLSGRVRVPA